MLFITLITVAVRTLLANKLRSFLAMLGIIIGVGSVIAMLSLGAGAQRQVTARISAMGTDLLIIRPGQRGFRGVMTGRYQNLTLQDARALLERIPEVRLVAPVVRGSAQLKYFNHNARASVIGTAITYFAARNFPIARGRAFTEGEVERRARVAVLGPVTVENLFAGADPLGETFKLNGINFRVVGVLKAKGDRGWYNPDDQAIVPYSTAMKQLFGLDTLHEIDLQAAGDQLQVAQDKATAVLRRQHRLGPDDPDDFYIRNLAEIQEAYASVSHTFTALLAGIASISLLVGGIGIMNIMLVTVTERTREIGIRKALGAKDRDIQWQFLIEAVLMSALGGVLGVAAGVAGAKLAEHLSPFASILEPRTIFLALSVSAAVGIFFGYYPARRAARLDPIEALRYE